MKFKKLQRRLTFCALFGVSVFGLSACNEEVVTDTIIIQKALPVTAGLTSVGPSGVKSPGAASAETQALGQRGINVLTYQCVWAVLRTTPGQIQPAVVPAQVMVLATIAAVDVTKIDPQSGFSIHDPQLFDLGEKFDCAANGW